IDADLRVIERPVVDAAVAVDHRPRRAAIARAPQHAVLRLDQRVDGRGIAAADRDADPAQHLSARQTVLQRGVGQLRPGDAAVLRLVEAAARAAAPEMPRLPLVVVHAGIDDVGIAGIDRDVARTGGVVDVQRARPRRAGVAGSEYAALGISSERMPHRGGKDDLRVRRVNDDAREALRLAESEVLPGAAAIGRLVDAVAERDRVADEAFAGADVDDIGIVGLYGDGADRQRPTVVEDRLESRPTIRGFVETRRGGGYVKDLGSSGNAGHVDDAAREHGGADGPPGQRLQRLSRNGRGSGWFDGAERETC